jgi:hypothetical protein
MTDHGRALDTDRIQAGHHIGGEVVDRSAAGRALAPPTGWPSWLAEAS